jgi:hypothetical protein
LPLIPDNCRHLPSVFFPMQNTKKHSMPLEAFLFSVRQTDLQEFWVSDIHQLMFLCGILHGAVGRKLWNPQSVRTRRWILDEVQHVTFRVHFL